MDLWDSYIYERLGIKNGEFKQLKLKFDSEFKELINELLSFVSTFKQHKFIHGDLKLDNILFDESTKSFSIKNFEKSKFQLTHLYSLTNSDYYFDFLTLYFSLYCFINDNDNDNDNDNNNNNNNEFLTYLQKEIVKYIPQSELVKFHNITNNYDTYTNNYDNKNNIDNQETYSIYSDILDNYDDYDEYDNYNDYNDYDYYNNLIDLYIR